MTTRRRIPTRAGFTLLELVLAMAIGVTLLAALYLALATHFHHAQAGRNLIEEAGLVRSLFTRMTGDISSSLGPVPTPSSTGTAGTTTTDVTTSNTLGMTNSGPVNLGVRGEAQRLVLTVSRVPRELDPARDTESAGVSDLRTITYWLVGQGDQAQGLARQEITRVTGPEADQLPPEVSSPETFLVSTRVRNLTFEYHDGSSWQSSWDGTGVDVVGQKAKGPPAAIAITLTVEQNGARRTYRHVVAIPAANRWSTAATDR